MITKEDHLMIFVSRTQVTTEDNTIIVMKSNVDNHK